MRREITNYLRYVSVCCPGHDMYPNDTYRNRRSKKARAKGKKAEHKHARHFVRMALFQELNTSLA